MALVPKTPARGQKTGRGIEGENPAAAGIKRFFSPKGPRREKSSECPSSKVVRTSFSTLHHQKIVKNVHIHINLIVKNSVCCSALRYEAHEVVGTRVSSLESMFQSEGCPGRGTVTKEEL